MYDKATKRIVFILDGKTIKEWEEPGAFSGKGNSLAFSVTFPHPTLFRNLEVTRWDGTVPTLSFVEKQQHVEFLDQAFLANGGRVVGKVIEIQKDTLRMESEGVSMEVPTDEVSEILFTHHSRRLH